MVVNMAIALSQDQREQANLMVSIGMLSGFFYIIVLPIAMGIEWRRRVIGNSPLKALLMSSVVGLTASYATTLILDTNGISTTVLLALAAGANLLAALALILTSRQTADPDQPE
jgi:uncharacterized membrane protein